MVSETSAYRSIKLIQRVASVHYVVLPMVVLDLMQFTKIEMVNLQKSAQMLWVVMQ